jgi:quercetin dioxygenase-like cupin family protein
VRHLGLTRNPIDQKSFRLGFQQWIAELPERPARSSESLYVLRGQLRVKVGDHDFIMGAGEAAEFDCQLPHWFGAAGRGSVEVLSLFGKHGERIHVRTRKR